MTIKQSPGDQRAGGTPEAVRGGRTNPTNSAGSAVAEPLDGDSPTECGARSVKGWPGRTYNQRRCTYPGPAPE